MRLIAIKPMNYGTRRLQAGDEFDAKPDHGRVLIAIKRALDPNKRERGVIAAPEPELAEKIVEVFAPEAEDARRFEDNLDSHLDQFEKAVEFRDVEPETEAAPYESPILAGLRAKAAGLGISVDGRWGVPRLQTEIGRALDDADK